MSTPLKTFTVTGTLPFPLDMLRHDQCFPLTGEDAGIMDIMCDSTTRHTYRKQLRKTDSQAVIRLGMFSTFGPTIGRWESFGWKVIVHE